MTANVEEWFESVGTGGEQTPRVSKFLREDFHVALHVIEARWPSWTTDQRGHFAAAFSARANLNIEDQRVLDYLIDKGEPRVWRTIALLVARHVSHRRAIEFLIERVHRDPHPLANYYQALGVIRDAETIPALEEALSRHYREVKACPVLESWGDRFLYLDYLSCSASLFLVTKKEEYRQNLSNMLKHSDPAIAKTARTVAMTSKIPM